MIGTDIVEVFYRTTKVGSLAITPDGLCAFEYETEFLKVGFSISPFYLPLKPGVFISKKEPFNGLFGVFNDSLPDGWGRLLTDRVLKQRNINISDITFLDRLCLVGSNGIGVLTYEPSIATTNRSFSSNLDEIAKDIELILNNEYTGNIEKLFAHGGSSGGARPKVMIDIKDKKWIVKFKSSSDPVDIGIIEYEYSLCAKKCGIEMTETKLFEDKYFGIERFDIVGNEKYHIHSASGLLYANHRIPSLDYVDLLKLTIALTKDINESYKIFRQMIFNILTCNKDDHSKNFSFIFNDNHWKLTPAYDLVLSDGFNGQHTTTIAGQGIPEKKDIYEVAKQSGLSHKKAKQIFDEVYDNTRELQKYIPPNKSCLQV